MRKSKFLGCLLLILSCCLLFGLAAMTASADPEPHTVTFYLEDGVAYEGQTQQVEDGGYAVVPPTPEKDGAIFIRWCYGNGERFSFKTAITEDVALYAEWQTLGEGETLAQIYTVEFWVGDSLVSRQSVEQGTDAIEPSGFDCPEGKTFVSWNGSFENVQSDVTVTANLTDSVYSVYIFGVDEAWVATQEIVHGGNVDLSAIPDVPHYTFREAIGKTEGITSDGEVYLIYDADEYDVTFLSDGEVFGTETVAYGGTVPFPDIPGKDDYIFIGWYLDPADATMFDFNRPIEGETTLYAKYIPIENKKFNVTFLQYDGTPYGGAQLVEEGKTPIAPGTPGREGYTFLGWYDEETGDLFDFTAPIESDKTARALFQINTYLVTVVAGDQVISEQEVKCGESAEVPEIPEIEGYDFVGFDGSFSNVRANTVIKVRYSVKTFSVMFYDANQKKIGGTQYVEFGKSATAPKAPEREGYLFVSWSEEFDDVREDLVIFPEYTLIEYTVRFFDGETELWSETVNHGEKTNGIQPEKDGFIFIGWLTGTDAAFDLNTPVKSDLTLRANWQEKPPVVHTVSFMIGDAIYSVQTVADGAAAQTPANPVKYGYTFRGWDADFSAVTEDLTVNALFDINVFTVTFTASGAIYDTVEVEYGSTVTPPSGEPEKNGYRFVRWNFDFDTPITDDLTIKAVFAVKTFEVKFVVEGEDYMVQTVEYGDYADIPATPVVSGKTFLGWYASEDHRFAFSTPIEDDLTITARFEGINCRLTFYGADGGVLETVSVEYGALAQAIGTEPEKEGYAFVGWNYDFTAPVTADAEIYPIYEAIVHTVTFTVNGEVWRSVSVTYGSQVSIPSATPRLTGYRFVRWNFNFNQAITSDTEIEAEIEAITYTVTFLSNNKVIGAVTVAEGETVENPGEIPAPEARLRFVGWDFDFGTPITSDTTISAKFEVITYTVSVNVFGEIVNTLTVEYGAAIGTLEDPTVPDGYRFLGWDYPLDSPIYGNLEIKARFEEIIPSFKVTFLVNGATYATCEVLRGSLVEEPEEPTLEGYVFLGWEFDFSTPITADTRIVAKFVELEPERFTVTFTVDGELFYSTDVYAGNCVAAPLGNPEKEGYTFVTWEFDFTTPITSDVTIKAIFRENAPTTYTVIFTVDGNMFTRMIVGEGDFVEEPDRIPEKEGYVFLGWDFNFETPITSDTVIAAVFEEIDDTLYTIRYYVNGKIYVTQDYVAGADVIPPETPILDDPTMIFVGWKNLPEKMPAHDVRVTAQIEQTAMDTNVFTLETVRNENGTLTAVILLTGRVNTAGFIGTLYFNNGAMNLIASDEYDPEGGVFMVVDDQIRFIWSSAYNLNEEIAYLSLTFEVYDGAEPNFSLVISELRALDESGTPVWEEYSVR